jgi:hypothetical protein
MHLRIGYTGIWGDTVLIYLSPTNLHSGTAFYKHNGEDNYQETGMIKYVTK